jgi:hypothetical protein
MGFRLSVSNNSGQSSPKRGLSISAFNLGLPIGFIEAEKKMGNRKTHRWWLRMNYPFNAT